VKAIKITDEILSKAKEWSTFSGNNFSIRKDGGNRLVGDIAEVVFQLMYPSAQRISDVDRNADFLIKGKRVDVKCKDRSVDCQLNYEVSIETRQLDFNVDWYAFFSFNNKTSVIQFLGWASKDEYLNKSKPLKKGDVDPSNGWIVNVDCNNLKVCELKAP